MVVAVVSAKRERTMRIISPVASGHGSLTCAGRNLGFSVAFEYSRQDVPLLWRRDFAVGALLRWMDGFRQIPY